MAGATYKDFANMIVAGERIEMLAKTGKIPTQIGDGSNGKKNSPMKTKEGDVNQILSVFSSLYQTPLSSQPSYQTPPPHSMLPSYPTAQPHQPNTTPYHYTPPTLGPQYQVNNIPIPRPYAPTHPYTQHQNYPHNRPNHNVQNHP